MFVRRLIFPSFSGILIKQESIKCLFVSMRLIFKKLLKPNGRIIVAVPNFKSYDARYFKKFWAAYDVPRHLWHFSKESIPKVFSRVQMSLESTHPMLMDAYYVSMLSNKYKTGSHRVFSSLCTGLLSNLKALKTGEYSSLIYVLKNKS